jgi:hypothetical protein
MSQVKGLLLVVTDFFHRTVKQPYRPVHRLVLKCYSPDGSDDNIRYPGRSATAVDSLGGDSTVAQAGAMGGV